MLLLINHTRRRGEYCNGENFSYAATFSSSLPDNLLTFFCFCFLCILLESLEISAIKIVIKYCAIKIKFQLHYHSNSHVVTH